MQPTRDAATVFDPRAALEARLGIPRSGEEPGEEAAGPESRGVRGVRLGMTLFWVLLAILATVLRMCQQPPG